MVDFELVLTKDLVVVDLLMDLVADFVVDFVADLVADLLVVFDEALVGVVVAFLVDDFDAVLDEVCFVLEVLVT